MLLGRVHPLVYTRARFLSSSILPVQATQPAAATVVCFRIQPKDLWFRFPVPCLVLPIETGPVQCCPVLAIEPGPVKSRGKVYFSKLKTIFTTLTILHSDGSDGPMTPICPSRSLVLVAAALLGWDAGCWQRRCPRPLRSLATRVFNIYVTAGSTAPNLDAAMMPALKLVRKHAVIRNR